MKISPPPTKTLESAAVVVARAENASRPIISEASAFLIGAGAGFMGMSGIAFVADSHFLSMPDKDGESNSRIDRVEARRLFSGHEGVTQYGVFLTLVSAGILYSKAKQGLSKAEHTMLNIAGYGVLGGGLAGTLFAPAMLPSLPGLKRPKTADVATN